MRWLGVTVIACLEACNASTFLCQSDEQCQNGAASGRCEPDGYCSFEDEDCPSGRRYGDLAPAGVAGTCVDPTTTTGAETGVEAGTAQPVTSLDTGFTTVNPGTTSEDPPPTSDGTGDTNAFDVPGEGCGNGVVDVGETCDDGNADNDDDCNDDCRVPGTEYFFELWDAGADDRCYDLDGETDGTFAIVGYTSGAAGTPHAAIRVYDLAGEEQWSYAHDPTTAAWGLARRDDGSYFVGGKADTGMTEQQPLILTVSDGALVWAEFLDVEGSVYGVDATEDDRLFVAGEARTSASDILHAFAAELSPDGSTLLWTADYDPSSVGSFWDVRFTDIGLFAVGTGTGPMSDDVAVLARLPPEGGLPEGLLFGSPASGRTGFWRVVPHGTDLYLAGTQSSASAAWEIWFGSFDTTTDSETLQTFGGGSNDEAFDIAVDADGNMYVAGFVINASQDAWVAKFAPGEQEPTWTWTYNGTAGSTDRAWALELADDGSVLVCGYATEGAGNVDIYVTRLAH